MFRSNTYLKRGMLLNFGGSTGRLLAISYTDDDNDAAKISVLFSVYRKISFRMPSLLQLKLACPTAGSFHKFLNYCWVVVVLLLWVWKCWNLNFYWPHSQHFDGIHFLRVMITWRAGAVLFCSSKLKKLHSDVTNNNDIAANNVSKLRLNIYMRRIPKCLELGWQVK